jgi:MYXO-CTERM domain-containing protein
MKRITGFAQAAIMAAAFAALPAVAQDRSATGSTSDMSRTSPVEVTRHEDRGFDLGWMGLLGLAGLAGLRRKQAVVHDTHVHREPGRTDRV